MSDSPVIHGLTPTDPTGTPLAARVSKATGDTNAGGLQHVLLVNADGTVAVLATQTTLAALQAALSASPTVHEFSSFGSAVDLTQKGAGYSRQLVFHGAGTVTLVTEAPYTSGGGGDTITVNDGDARDIQATSIAAVSGVTSITVLW